jgi:hypothetical protein
MITKKTTKSYLGEREIVLSLGEKFAWAERGKRRRRKVRILAGA